MKTGSTARACWHRLGPLTGCYGLLETAKLAGFGVAAKTIKSILTAESSIWRPHWVGQAHTSSLWDFHSGTGCCEFLLPPFRCLIGLDIATKSWIRAPASASLTCTRTQKWPARFLSTRTLRNCCVSPPQGDLRTHFWASRLLCYSCRRIHRRGRAVDACTQVGLDTLKLAALCLQSKTQIWSQISVSRWPRCSDDYHSWRVPGWQWTTWAAGNTCSHCFMKTGLSSWACTRYRFWGLAQSSQKPWVS